MDKVCGAYCANDGRYSAWSCLALQVALLEPRRNGSVECIEEN